MLQCKHGDLCRKLINQIITYEELNWLRLSNKISGSELVKWSSLDKDNPLEMAI